MWLSPLGKSDEEAEGASVTAPDGRARQKANLAERESEVAHQSNFNAALIQRNAELVEQNAQLSEAVAARDAFLAVAAHELRNPMTPIVGRVQRLRRMLQSADFQSETLEKKFGAD